MIEIDVPETDVDSWSVEVLTELGREELKNEEECKEIFSLIGSIAIRNKGIIRKDEN